MMSDEYTYENLSNHIIFEIFVNPIHIVYLSPHNFCLNNLNNKKEISNEKFVNGTKIIMSQGDKLFVEESPSKVSNLISSN